MARPRPLPYRSVPVGDDGVAYVFDPVRGAPEGAVVIVPGLAVLAHDDPRLHTLARAFAAARLRGIVLEVPDMGRLRIRPETEVDLAIRLRRLHDDGHIPEGRLGLLGPSFSGSLALRAAARPEAHDLVKSVITVGAFADGARIMRFLFQDPTANPYGRMVLMHNFLHEVRELPDGVREALHTAILDTSRPPEEMQLPGLRDRLGAAEREELDGILEDPVIYRAIGKELEDQGGAWFQAMSVTPIVDQLGCSVFVMHGASDDIVPASESHHLHADLERAGRPSYLLITGLLDHASIQIGTDVVQQTLGMHRGFSFFLRGLGL